jgi:hypothetical protein
VSSRSTSSRWLAESPDDAKARAETDLRRRGQFEDIQDSWPEEIASVEALAVEPYLELVVDGLAAGALKTKRRLRLIPAGTAFVARRGR